MWNEKHSDRLELPRQLRTDAQMGKRIRELAKSDRRTIQQQILYLLEKGLGRLESEAIAPTQLAPIHSERLPQVDVEIVRDDADEIFEPFFQPKTISAEIRKRQTVPQQRKWHAYFEKWSCLICARKDRPHVCLGMCAACYQRTSQRLQSVLRSTEEDGAQSAARFTPDRLTELATGAVRKQLSAETPSSGARTYLTEAEREAQRAEREKLWRQAKTLHEQGFTWRETAQRLDPVGFAKDPKAARARIISGARLVSHVRDLAEAAGAVLLSGKENAKRQRP